MISHVLALPPRQPVTAPQHTPACAQDFNGYLVSMYDACIDRLCTWENRATNLYRFPTRIASIDA
jgi:hypothetical protein